jgi:hypothetical protein
VMVSPAISATAIDARRPMRALLTPDATDRPSSRSERLGEIRETPGSKRGLANGGLVVPRHVDDRHGNVRCFVAAYAAVYPYKRRAWKAKGTVL